ncbi:MAG: pyruvate kinase [Desulfobulbaceae bacterium]|nr:pyruvate kinase [Desulfobulbaceae bacterium]
MMKVRAHKTKIICTIGPASRSPGILEKMIMEGMDIARINFSHGDPEGHREIIANVRAAAERTGRQVAIMGDLPGPKIRIGRLEKEPMELDAEDMFILTVGESADGIGRIRVNFDPLPQVVKKGDILFLDDGLIQVEVVTVTALDVGCRVMVGGELRSHKGLNLPGISLGIKAFTREDREWLQFAREQKLDAISQSFVESAEDIEEVREAAGSMDYDPFIIAKIERAQALSNIDAVLRTADGIMIARGDLGVEVPIEQIAGIQKDLIHRANQTGKPVITATQMLESMTGNRRPTRAEVTDVANAILDGTDCVMLSGESAIGRYPVDAVRMLARIAVVVEPKLSRTAARMEIVEDKHDLCLRDFVAWNAGVTLQHLSPALVIVPTRSGATARSIVRFRSPVWILAVSSRMSTCRNLLFSYGVHPKHEPGHPENWKEYARQQLEEQGFEADIVLLTEGPSKKHPDANHRMEMIDLRLPPGAV